MSKKNKIALAQNKHNKDVSKSLIFMFSEEEKKDKIQELEKKGYEYNSWINTLLKMDTVIPYEFVLYCMLIKDTKKERM